MSPEVLEDLPFSENSLLSGSVDSAGIGESHLDVCCSGVSVSYGAFPRVPIKILELGGLWREGQHIPSEVVEHLLVGFICFFLEIKFFGPILPLLNGLS